MKGIINQVKQYGGKTDPKFVDELRPLAREWFPEIEDEFISRNALEFNRVKEVRDKCAVCLSLEMCPELLGTNGFQTIPTLSPRGDYISLQETACRYRRVKDGIFHNYH